ncbi:MAG: hypothetical protein Q8R08_04680, partial [bacterium]|nr:hypothetical protein [bacterium]
MRERPLLSQSNLKKRPRFSELLYLALFIFVAFIFFPRNISASNRPCDPRLDCAGYAYQETTITYSFDGAVVTDGENVYFPPTQTGDASFVVIPTFLYNGGAQYYGSAGDSIGTGHTGDPNLATSGEVLSTGGTLSASNFAFVVVSPVNSTLDGSLAAEGPNGTVFDSVSVTCTDALGNTTMQTQPVTMSVLNGNQTLLVDGISFGSLDASCETTMNFITPGNSSQGSATTYFSGVLEITPKNISVNPGGTADYSVKFTKTNAYSGPVYLHLLPGNCPAGSTCTFPSGNSLSFSVNPLEDTKTFRVVTSGATPLNRYVFTISSTQSSTYNSSDLAASDSAGLIVGQTTAPVDHALFIRYENVPSTMNPGQTTAVKVVMRNDGTTTWKENSGGIDCFSSPPNNGYYLHSHGPRDNRIWD